MYLGASALFKCSCLLLNPKFKLSTRWQFNGGSLNDSRTYFTGLHGELIIPNVQNSDNGVYSCDQFSPDLNMSVPSNQTVALAIKLDAESGMVVSASTLYFLLISKIVFESMS